MNDLPQVDYPAAQLERGRRSARRTAWILGAIVLAVYVGFMLLGALGR